MALDEPLGGPDEFSLLEGTCGRPRRLTNGVLARQLFYEGTVAYKTGDFPVAAEKFKEGLKIWKARHGRFPHLPRRRPEQEGNRPDRQAVRPRSVSRT